MSAGAGRLGATILRRRAEDLRGGRKGPFLAQAQRGRESLGVQARLALRRTEVLSVNLVVVCQPELHIRHSPSGLTGNLIEARGPCFAFDRHALNHRRALRKHTLEIMIGPAGRKIDVVVAVTVRINEPCKTDEGQIRPVDRMRHKQRISGRQLDGPEAVELQDEAVLLEERRPLHLVVVVKIERRTNRFHACARNLAVPREDPVVDVEVGSQRNEKTVGHRIDERRTSLDRHLIQLEPIAEGALRHRLEPVRQTLHGRDGRRHQALVLRRAAENDREAFGLLAHIVAHGDPPRLWTKSAERGGNIPKCMRGEGVAGLQTHVNKLGPPALLREPRQQGHRMTSITPFLWFNNNVPEAVAFYRSVFPNAKVETVNDFMASFELEGQRFNALNGGPQYKFNEAVSFFISVETQEQIDYFWTRLTADGGEESRCGWLKDKFGLSWQVVPTALGRYLGDPDRSKANRVMQAMMQMRKIVIVDLDRAYAG